MNMTDNLTYSEQPYFVCNEGLILPLINESIWSREFRSVLYLVGLLWSFTAMAIIADTFMCAIEVITSKTTEVKVAKPGNEEGFEIVKVRVWNDTVANLTLMALGSSAPEILLNIIEICGNKFVAGALGPGTIVGSASFNLLVIIAVCVYGIPEGDIRKIKRLNVFAVTAVFSILAYVWVYIVLLVSTPDEIELWEAIVTFLLFPVLVLIAFVADKKYGCQKKVKDDRLEIELGNRAEETSLMKRQSSEDDKTNEVVNAFLKAIDKPEKMNEEDAVNIATLKLQDSMPHSRAWYRVKASREMFAGQRLEPHISEDLHRLSDTIGVANGNTTFSVKEKLEIGEILNLNKKVSTVIEFDAVSCSVMENCGSVKLIVIRTGDLSQTATIRYETIDGTANAGEDYIAQDEVLIFEPKQSRGIIEIEIVDDNVWEPDETFFVKLSIPKHDMNENLDDYVQLGRKVINQITIINDDEPGTIEFGKPSYLVKESVGTAYIPVNRVNGADGVIDVQWKTSDISGKEGINYVGKEGVVTFEHGEDVKNIEIEIINDHATKKDENFQIVLLSASGGASIGNTNKTVVSVVGDDEFESLVRRVAAKTHLKLVKLKLGSQSWAEQFTQAMNVNGGDTENATAGDYVMHFLTFGFKVICACIPPPNIWGGWACFFSALVVLMGLTAIVSDLASIAGCLIYLPPTITAITFVALGTSLPDLFASKSAAIQERYADNSIGNVTGSNSVNVFLGLGTPWLMATLYWQITEGTTFKVNAGTIGFSVALYAICAVICLLTLMARRYLNIFGNAELGGPKGPKTATAVFFCFLWVMYIAMSSLQAVGVIGGF